LPGRKTGLFILSLRTYLGATQNRLYG